MFWQVYTALTIGPHTSMDTLAMLLLVGSLFSVINFDQASQIIGHSDDRACTDKDAVPQPVSKYNGKWYVQGYTSPTGHPRYRFEYIVIRVHKEKKTGTYSITYVTFQSPEVHHRVYDLHEGDHEGTFVYWDYRVPCLRTLVTVVAESDDGMVLYTRAPNGQKPEALIVTSRKRQYSEDKIYALLRLAISKCGHALNFTRVQQNNCQ